MERARRAAAPLLAAAVLSAGALAGCGNGDGNTGPEPAATIRVTNNGASIVQRLFIRDCEAFQWGPDVLGLVTLGVGSSADFEVAAGCHDLRAFVFPEPDPAQIDTLFDTGVVVAAGEVYTWEITGQEPEPQE